MTDLMGGNILIDRAEYSALKYRADLGEALLSHMLRNYTDDQWMGNTRFMMDECAVAFWGAPVEWNIDEEENEDD